MREADADTALRNHERLVEVCQTLAAEVQPSIGRLVVRVAPSSASGLRVYIGDAELPAALLGVPSPVMPGSMTIRAEATGFRSASREVEVAAGHEAQVDIALDRTDASSSTARPTSTVLTPQATRTARASTGPGAGPWVLVGVGGVGLAAGLTMFFLSNAAQSDRDTACGGAGCQEVARDDDTRYRGLLLGTNIALGVGGAAVAGGLLWWLLAPRGERAPATATVVPLQGGAAFQMGGRL